MNYWWVNQNQTYKHEVNGGYIWSPKTNANGGTNQFYINMTKVDVGDVVFCFKDTLVKAIGIATSKVYEQPKPSEFGSAGENWGALGWCINVDYFELSNQVRPKDHVGILAPSLPEKYSPLQANGNGNQGVYLAYIPEKMASVLLKLIGSEAKDIISNVSKAEIESNESDVIEQEIKQNTKIQNTEKEQLVKSRRGQGVFRTNVERIEAECRVTKVTAKAHLIASHIKPWKVSTNFERLDGNNGLLLSPHIDSLFDKGYISFHDNGNLLVSKEIDANVLNCWNVRTDINVGLFNDKQRVYLSYHRDNIFRK